MIFLYAGHWTTHIRKSWSPTGFWYDVGMVTWHTEQWARTRDTGYYLLH